MELHAHPSSFVGGDMGDAPYISDFGAFIRVVRLNRLRPQDYFAAFGMRVKRRDDLSAILTFSQTRQAQFWRAIGTPPPSTASLEAWIPAKGAVSVLERGWLFRFCPECLRQAYHCNLMQMPWMAQCPVHRIPLRTTCPQCDGRVDATGERGERLMVCACGYDLVDERLASRGNYLMLTAAQRTMWPYLDWALQARVLHRLIAPAEAADLSPLVELMHFPACLLHDAPILAGSSKPHLRHLRKPRRVSIHDTASARMRLEALASSDPGIVEMPNAMLGGLRATAKALIRSLPERSLSRGELALFMGFGVDVDDVLSMPAPRKAVVDIAYLPPHHVAGKYFLSFHAMDKTASQAAHSVMEQVLGPGYGTRVKLGEAEADVPLALLTVEAILLRAYSEGMRTVLAKYVKGMASSRKTRPRLSVPWILLSADKGRLSSTRIAWFSSGNLALSSCGSQHRNESGQRLVGSNVVG